MAWTNAFTELREFLSDTKFNKRASGKQVKGQVNGMNQAFITYDKRFIEDTFEVFVNDLPAKFQIVDSIAGTFTICPAPDVNSTVVASYYWQWWLDSELQTYLNKAAESMGIDDTQHPDGGADDVAYLAIPQGLRGAALNLAASYAQAALVQYMMNRKHSGEFLLEQDGNDDAGFAQIINAMTKQKQDYYKTGIELRDDFYKRQGREFAPSVRIKVVASRRYGPSR